MAWRFDSYGDAAKRLKQAVYRGESVRIDLAYPKGPSEFEVQALLYCRLRKMGYRVRAEVVSLGSYFCRVDLAVFDRRTRKLLLVIEVKKTAKRKRTGKADGQEYLYKRLCAPVKYVRGLREAMDFLRRVRAKGLPTN